VNYKDDPYDYSSSEESSGYVLAAIGGVLYLGGIIYGYFRPPTFARQSASVAKGPVDPAAWNLALVSDKRGNPSFRLAYTMSF
jgi:hypothetical protein